MTPGEQPTTMDHTRVSAGAKDMNSDASVVLLLP
jgi:hypothetical protein